ncbi:MAG: ectoine hydrolase DoeA [Pseudomonadota bacterium]|nr:ectoine hydrolase DoeA [Pseudomonadota bacterium]
MPDLTLPFSRDEYADRLQRTRQAMAAAGIETLIVVDPSNMAWLTGYDGWSFYVHQAVVVGPHGDPVWFGRGQDVNGARRTVYMAGADIAGYDDHYVQSTERHPMEVLAAELRRRGFARGPVGVEMDNYYYSAKADAVLRAHLPDARFVDATALVNWQRAVKSPRELDYMRRAARIVDTMMGRIVEKAEPGVRKCDLVAEIQDAALRGVGPDGGDYAAIVPLIGAGADGSAPHLTWDESPLRDNEGVFFEVAGCYRRYHCPLTRTVHFGQPPERFRAAEQAVLEGMARGLEIAREGNTCEDVAKAFFATLRRHGFEKNSRTGYPIGLSYPPDWGERTMSFREGDRTVLRQGMTFHFMTGLWLDDWGIAITESIVIGEHGAECLASVPRELFVKDAATGPIMLAQPSLGTLDPAAEAVAVSAMGSALPGIVPPDGAHSP